MIENGVKKITKLIEDEFYVKLLVDSNDGDVRQKINTSSI